MTGSLGEAVLDLVADSTQLNKDIGKAKKTTQQSLKDLGGSLTKFGLGMTASVTLPIVMMGLGMVNAASDVEESLSKARVVFGEFAGDVIEASETAAVNWGMSQGQALEALGTFGNLFTAMGVGGQEAAGLSENVVGLSADLASFNNIDPGVVLEKLRAGLTGEAEGLKSLGIVLRATEVEQRALEAAISDGRDEVTEADRITARYAIIMEQTASAQGDFARTSDGLANSSRIVQAQLSDQAAALGQELLPLALQAVTWFRELLEKFQALDPSVKTNILRVMGLAAALGPVIMFVGALISGISGIIGIVTTVGPILGGLAAILTGPVGIAIAAVAALVGVLYLAWKNNFLGIQEAVQVFVTFVKTVFAAFKAAFAGDWNAFGSLLREAWDGMWSAVQDRFAVAKQWLIDTASNLIENLIKFFTETDWQEVGADIIKGIRAGVINAAGTLAAAAIEAVQAALEAVKGLLKIKSPSQVFRDEIGVNMALGVGEGFVHAVPEITSDIEGGLGSMVDALNVPNGNAAPRSGALIGTANIYNSMDLNRFAAELKRRV